METKKLNLSENEIEVLKESMCVFERPHNGVSWNGSCSGWFTPYCIGGGNKSHHSYTLKKLEKKGLIQSENRWSLSGIRGSKVYKITETGKDYVREHTNYKSYAKSINKIQVITEKKKTGKEPEGI